MDLSSLGAGSSAVWTRAAAARLLTATAIDRKLRTEWQSPYPGVYADAGYDLDPVQWAYAGVLASGGADRPQAQGRPDASGLISVQLPAAPCGRDAARVWGLPLIDDDDPATGGSERYLHDVHSWASGDELVAPRVGQEPSHVLRRHRLTLLEGDLVQHDSGLWLTSPLHTALHCCVLLPFESAVCVMDAALHRDLFTTDELAAALELRAGHPAIASMRAVAGAADGRAEAPTETLLRLILKPGWPELEPQVRVYDERTYPIRRYDLGDREIKLGVEGDGKRNHAGAVMAAKDHGLDRRVGRYGWTTERATWFQVRREQASVRERIHRTRDRLRARRAA